MPGSGTHTTLEHVARAVGEVPQVLGELATVGRGDQVLELRLLLRRLGAEGPRGLLELSAALEDVLLRELRRGTRGGRERRSCWRRQGGCGWQAAQQAAQPRTAGGARTGGGGGASALRSGTK